MNPSLRYDAIGNHNLLMNSSADSTYVAFQKEYERWVRQVEEDKEPYPEPSFIREKVRQIREATEHVFTAVSRHHR